MSKPSTNPRLRCTSVDFLESEFPCPITPRLVIRLNQGLTILIEFSVELARKDKIIEGLRQRLFGSSSEKLDPAQLQLLFDEIDLGKPALPPPRLRRICRRRVNQKPPKTAAPIPNKPPH